MPVPEIQRCSLAGVALQLLAIGVDITSFDFMDRPPKEAVDVAVTCLEKLAAVKGISIRVVKSIDPPIRRRASTSALPFQVLRRS